MELYYQDLKCKRYVKVCEEERYGFWGGSPAEYDMVDDEMAFTYCVDDEDVMPIIIMQITERKLEDISKREYDILYEYVEEHFDDLVEEYEDYIKDYFEEEASEEATKGNY